MAEGDFKHKLAAILSGDVVAYSRLIAEDEVSTVRILNAYRSEIVSPVKRYRGRVVDFVGDNMLAEFLSAMFTYKTKPVTISELGQQLGVRHVLEGGVRKSGNHVRVNVQIVESSNGRRIWADRAKQ